MRPALRPGALPQVSAREAEATRHARRWLCATGGDLGARLEALSRALSQEAGAALAWRFLGARAAPTLEALALPAASAARGWLGSLEVMVCLEQPLALTWLDLHFGRLSPERALRPLGPLEEGLLLARLAWACALLGASTLRVDATPAAAQALAARLARADGLLALEAELSCHTTTGRLWIIGGERPLRRLLSDAPARPAALRAWCQGRALPQRLTLRLARAPLPWRALQALAPGQVLVSADIAHPHVTLCAGHAPLWSCALEGDPLGEHALRLGDLKTDKIDARRTMTRDEHSPGEHSPHEHSPHEDPLARLPVEVTVELARLELSLAEVAALGPGQVVPLRRPLHQPVTLRAGAEVLAQGELVEIEGQLGVRITAVTRPGGAGT